MFIDKIHLKFKSGNGGNGHVSFDETGKPSGGIGGNGGDIIIEGTIHKYDLSNFKKDTLFEAQNGEHGGKKNLTGKNGENLTIKVPLTTKFYDLEGNLVFEVNNDKEQKIFLKGGIGGLGNHYFKRGGITTLTKFQEGKEGEFFNGYLELELKSDIIFIGFPNAGKSSILSEITNADAKVAPYAFTTLIPQLGITENNITLMDLPGLIEKTSEGKGLGTKFEKHTRRSKALAHFISLESENILKDYKKIREELKNITHNLFEKPEIIILTKSDLVTTSHIKKQITKLKKHNPNIFVVSSYDYDSLQNLQKEMKNFLQNLK